MVTRIRAALLIAGLLVVPATTLASQPDCSAAIVTVGQMFATAAATATPRPRTGSS